MMPINNTIYSTPNVNNDITMPNFKLDLIRQWEAWAKNVQLGAEELRDVALLRLMDCLERNVDNLDFNGLNLTELPTNLPPTLLKLDVSDNRLTGLPENLPPMLKVLDISGNQLTNCQRKSIN